MSGLTIDNTAGDVIDSSTGKTVAKNTDGFDVGNQAPLTIMNRSVFLPDVLAIEGILLRIHSIALSRIRMTV